MVVLALAVLVGVGLVPPSGGEEASTARCGGESAQVVGTGQFTLVGSGGEAEVSYATPANLVFCQRTSQSMVWIRLAEETGANGEDGPHLDIDLCNVTSSGDFSAMRARANPCPGGQTWALWWHDGDGGVFANGADATECELSLEVDDTGLAGTFSCRGLEDLEGDVVHVLNGSFRCAWQEGL